MTIEDIRNAIEFTSFEEPDLAANRLVATLRLSVSTLYSQLAVQSGPQEYLERLQDDLRERLLRALFEDQRRALFLAVNELLAARPMDTQALLAARDKLMAAARYQEAKAPA